MKNIFTEHPHSLGKTYWEHLHHALVAGREMIGGGVKAVVHGFFPFILEAPEKPDEGDRPQQAHTAK